MIEPIYLDISELDGSHDNVHIDVPIMDTIRMYLGFNNITADRCRCEYNRTLDCYDIFFGNCHDVDLRKYSFTKKVTMLIIQSRINKHNINLSFLENLNRLIIGYDYNGELNILTFPDAIEELIIQINRTTVGIKFPSNLKKLKFGTYYTCSLVGVNFPIGLITLEMGSIKSLVDVKLPVSLQKIIIKSPEVMTTINDITLPYTITSLELNYGIRYDTEIINVPSNFTDVTIHNPYLLDKLAFPYSIKTLRFMETSQSLNNLPNNIEELYIENVYDSVTNLPSSLTKIITKYMTKSNVESKFKRLPYGCIVTNDEGVILLSQH
ncbi:MAG: hypothetical protein Gaeavirus35_6 [Gaeavirus sp.]|uniref:FNIP repeat-containing protein n=1 Tax=Gaeavirus sp. TaxID=2487767 RepID=A0A3G4ZZE5_9VIRU|nr:MAG: hypothetical protein Gaeavirus35_6 [Gaeavirus sp.]